MHTYYISCDGTGTDSVQSIVDEHLGNDLSVFEVMNFSDFDKVCSKILPLVNKGDLVIVDTLTILADNSRMEYKIGSDWKVSYWDFKDKLLTDTYTRNVYAAVSGLIMARLRNFRNMGCRLITTAHERSGADPNIPKSSKIRLPDLNSALTSSLTGSSSVTGRLMIEHEGRMNEDGEYLVRKGGRVLQIGPSDDYYTKVHFDDMWEDEDEPPFPTEIVRPSYPKLQKILGRQITWLTIYGPPGVGKTKFALSHFIDLESRGMGR